MTVQDELTRRATWQAALAEVVATAFLALAVLLSGGPFAVALVLTVFVFAIGGISGASLNPAVTVGLVVARHMSWSKGVLYIVAEVVGAFIALAVAPLIHPLAASYAASSVGGEFFGFGILMCSRTSAAISRSPPAVSLLGAPCWRASLRPVASSIRPSR